jgi:hypothetical protein
VTAFNPVITAKGPGHVDIFAEVDGIRSNTLLRFLDSTVATPAERGRVAFWKGVRFEP